MLLKNNIIMTDLKPGNSLYNKINKKGQLIDLGGVYRGKNE